MAIVILKKKIIIIIINGLCMLYYPLKKISGDKTQFYDCLYFICLWFLIFFKWFMCAILLCIRIVSFDKRGKIAMD